MRPAGLDKAGQQLVRLAAQEKHVAAKLGQRFGQSLQGVMKSPAAGPSSRAQTHAFLVMNINAENFPSACQRRVQRRIVGEAQIVAEP